MNKSLGALALSCVLGASALAAPREEISEQDFRVPADVSLTVRNTDGTVYVYAWAEAVLRVMMRKRSYSPERLKKISAKIAVNGGKAVIETTFPPKPQGLSLADRSGTVDYLILVPQRATIEELELGTGEIIVDGMYGRQVNARLTNGRMTVHNCFSETHANVTDGALDVFYDWWEPLRFPFQAEIARGHLRLDLPFSAAAQIEAQSGDGKVFSQFTPNGQIEQGRSLHIVVGNDNGAEFKLKAAHGNIAIRKVE
jgi:hypothetical protein